MSPLHGKLHSNINTNRLPPNPKTPGVYLRAVRLTLPSPSIVVGGGGVRAGTQHLHGPPTHAASRMGSTSYAHSCDSPLPSGNSPNHASVEGDRSPRKEFRVIVTHTRARIVVLHAAVRCRVCFSI